MKHVEERSHYCSIKRGRNYCCQVFSIIIYMITGITGTTKYKCESSQLSAYDTEVEIKFELK